MFLGPFLTGLLQTHLVLQAYRNFADLAGTTGLKWGVV